MPTVRDYARGNLALLSTWVKGLRILNRLPHALWTARSSCEIHVPLALREEYEGCLSSLRTHLVTKTPSQRSSRATLALLVAQRLLWIAAATTQDLRLFTAVGLLQFGVAPYSLAVSLMTSGMYFATMCLGHLLTALLFLPVPAWPTVEFSSVAALVLVADQLVCGYYAFLRKGSRQFPWHKALLHVAYGTFNTKGYILLLLLFLRGSRVNLGWLLLDAAFGLGALVNNCVQGSCLAWECMFYHSHRLAHLPMVYEQAHKTHHFLHDTTAFDGHIYSGSGFPEEWFLFFYDIAALKLLGAPPPFLTWGLMKHQLANKEGHQRKVEGASDGEQYHQDHHLLHRVNFGFARPMLDLYFGTCRGDCVVLDNAKFRRLKGQEGVVVFRVEVDGAYDAGTSQDLPWWSGLLKGSE